MINNHVVMGSRSTTLFTSNFRTDGMNLIMSKGEYVNTNNVLASTNEDIIISIPSTDVTKKYDIYLVKGESQIVVHATDEQEFFDTPPEGMIDKLAWFIVPSNTTDLKSVEINVLNMKEETGNES